MVTIVYYIEIECLEISKTVILNGDYIIICRCTTVHCTSVQDIGVKFLGIISYIRTFHYSLKYIIFIIKNKNNFFLFL